MAQLSKRKCEVRLIYLEFKSLHNFDTLKRKHLKNTRDINFVLKYKNANTVLDMGLRAIRRNSLKKSLRKELLI